MINTGALRRIVIDKAIVGQLVSDLSLIDAEDELRVNLSSHSLPTDNSVDAKGIWANIPTNWTWTNLDNLTNNESLNDGDWVLKKDMSDTGEVKLIQLSSIGNCFFKDKNHKLLTEEHFYELNGKQIFPGYMLINRLVTDRMNACIIPKINGILMTAVDVCWVKPVDDLYNIEYLMYALSSSGVQNMVSQLGHGVTRFRISKTNLVKIPIPFPPLALQNEIVNRIKEIFSLLDKIEQMKSQYDADIEVLKSKIIAAGIRGQLTEQLLEDGNAEQLFADIQCEKKQLIKEKKIKKEKPLSEISVDEIPFDIPENWKWVRLGTCINLLSGQDFKPEDYNDCGEGMPYMTGASNIENESLIINRWTKTPKNISHKDDLLLVCKGSGYGKIAFNNVGDVHIARQFMAISSMSHIDLKYIAFVLKANIRTIRSNGQGLIPGIDRLSVLNLLLPLPPYEEQKRIVQKLNMLLLTIE